MDADMPKDRQASKVLDIAAIRRDFPILDTSVGAFPLCYLDNAATTQVPKPVLDHLLEHYETANANIHRGLHHLASLSTVAYEHARAQAAAFVNAADPDHIVFTKGTTNSINMVASGLSRRLKAGDKVVATALEHHSNYVPWQKACERSGATFVVAGLDGDQCIDLEHLSRCAEGATIVAATCCSNITGEVTPFRSIVDIAHKAGALCLLDGAQAMRHVLMDVQDAKCDYLCFSGHKMMAPTGIGVLYGTQEALEMLDPSEYGGEMVDIVREGGTTLQPVPLRLEAGTPNYVGAIMLGHAIDYLISCDREAIRQYEDELLAHAEMALRGIGGLQIIGNPKNRSGCLSFNVHGVHPLDLCVMLNQKGIALRSGNSCAQPFLHGVLGINHAARLSVAFYNTMEEIDRAAEVIRQTIPLVRQNF